MLPQGVSVPERSSMGNVQNTTTAKRTGARRSVLAFGAAIVLSLVALPAIGQGVILNDFQRELLDIEQETKAFINFVASLKAISIRPILEQAIPQAELEGLKDNAEQLLSLTSELQYKAHVLAGESRSAPGTELDAEALYRLSAHSLDLYFSSWDFFLRQLIMHGEPTSPTDFWWNWPSDQLKDDARIYRQLANIQYRLDQLEAE